MKALRRVPRNGIAWMLILPPVFPADLLSAGAGGRSVIRLSLGRQLFSPLIVSGQTDYY